MGGKIPVAVHVPTLEEMVAAGEAAMRAAWFALFDAVRLMVIEGGGDGDGWIIHPRYREVARLFVEREHSLKLPWFTEYHEESNRIYVANGYEAIWFSPSREDVCPAGEIIVEVLLP